MWSCNKCESCASKGEFTPNVNENLLNFLNTNIAIKSHTNLVVIINMLANDGPLLMLHFHIWTMLLTFAFLETLTSWWLHIKKVHSTIIAFFLVKVWHLSSCLWQKFLPSWSYLLASFVNCTTLPLSLINVELNTLVKPRIGSHHNVLCGIGDFISCFEIIKLLFHHFQVGGIYMIYWLY